MDRASDSCERPNQSKNYASCPRWQSDGWDRRLNQWTTTRWSCQRKLPQAVKSMAEFPGIRLRFTPGRGLVYGHTAGGVIPESRAIYDPVAGGWDMHSDSNTPSHPEVPRAAQSTVPGGVYARTRQGTNLGYFDDACDGIDGIGPVHDQQRPFRSGRGSYDHLLSRVEPLLKKQRRMSS